MYVARLFHYIKSVYVVTCIAMYIQPYIYVPCKEIVFTVILAGYPLPTMSLLANTVILYVVL